MTWTVWKALGGGVLFSEFTLFIVILVSGPGAPIARYSVIAVFILMICIPILAWIDLRSLPQ